MNSVETLVQEGIRLAAMGGRAEARALFSKAVQMDPRNEAAWVWLAELAEDDEERIGCLENVLQINPRNRGAEERLASLREPAAGTEPPQVDDSAAQGAEKEIVSPGEPIEQAATIECWRCGVHNPATNMFCGRCGVSLAEPKQEAVGSEGVGSVRSEPAAEPPPSLIRDLVPPAEMTGMESSKRRGGRTWTWLPLVGAGVALSLLVLCLVAWASGLVEVQGLMRTNSPPSEGAKATTPASGGSGDSQYLVCAQDVMIEWADLTGVATQGATDLAGATTLEEVLQVFCPAQDQWETRAQRVQENHSSCPMPSDLNLRTARQYVENGLGEMVAGIGFFGAY